MAHSGKTITFATDILPNEDGTYSLGKEDTTTPANNRRWKIFGDVTGTTSAVKATLDTSSKLYILGNDTAPTAGGVSAELKGNTKLFLSTTQHLTAMALAVHDNASTPVEKAYIQWNSTDSALEFVFT